MYLSKTPVYSLHQHHIHIPSLTTQQKNHSLLLCITTDKIHLCISVIPSSTKDFILDHNRTVQPLTSANCQAGYRGPAPKAGVGNGWLLVGKSLKLQLLKKKLAHIYLPRLYSSSPLLLFSSKLVRFFCIGNSEKSVSKSTYSIYNTGFPDSQ